MTNLEIKVLTKNIEEIRNKALEINALDNGILTQKDTYFLVGEKRLKLREQGTINYLIYYIRSNINDSKKSKYYTINIPKILVKLTKKLFSIIFGVKVIVHKKRSLLLYKNTRIHLDDVENLGAYVELETIFTKNKKEKELNDEHNFIITSLGLNTLEKISNSYSDMIIEHNSLKN
jgi:adenylate cyclase class IV